MKNIETIIWDLDGTLLDSFGVFKDVLEEVLPSHGREVPAEEIMLHNYHGTLADSINNVLGGVGESQLEQIVLDFLRQQDKYYEVIEHRLFADALDFAKRANQNGMFQVLVTNRDHAGRNKASPRHIVANSSLNGLIGEIVCGDDTQHRKPKPEVIGALIASGKVAPESTLVIGDQFVDGEFALNLGAQAVLVGRNGNQIPHIEKLGDSRVDFVTVVTSLNDFGLSQRKD